MPCGPSWCGAARAPTASAPTSRSSSPARRSWWPSRPACFPGSSPREEATMYYRLHDLTWEDAQRLARPGTVAVIPTGSTEQHGRHLPVEVDSRLVFEVAARASELAGERIDVVLAPLLAYGASHHHLEFAGTMSLSLPTYINVLADLADSLIGFGRFSHVLFLNGHGGN